MMKKLIFCLLVLTGAGMLNSCQQDEVVNETPASKGATIRASLPSDAQSRLLYEEATDDSNKTKLSWQSGDEIKVKITVDGVEKEYTFTTTGSGTTATFTCANAPAQLPAGNYIFTYGSAYQREQSGIVGGNNTFHRMECSYEASTDVFWSSLNLEFVTTVALVEITLPISTAKVSLYDANTGARLAYTQSKTFPDNKVYFALPHETACKGFVLAETNSNTAYVAAVGQKTLYEGKLYRINNNKFSQSITPTSCGTDVKYVIYGDVVYVYGNGEIPDNYFELNGSPTKDLSFNHVIISDGITKIGEAAFHQRPIMSVSIPESVNEIKKYAFKQSGLTSVTIPGSVQTIESEAFKGCQSLNNVTINDGMKSQTIKNEAFAGCKDNCVVNIWRTTAPTLEGEKQFGNNIKNYIINIPMNSNSYVGDKWGYYSNNNQIHAIL